MPPEEHMEDNSNANNDNGAKGPLVNLVPKPPGKSDDRNDLKKTKKSHFYFWR